MAFLILAMSKYRGNCCFSTKVPSVSKKHGWIQEVLQAVCHQSPTGCEAGIRPCSCNPSISSWTQISTLTCATSSCRKLLSPASQFRFIPIPENLKNHADKQMSAECPLTVFFFFPATEVCHLHKWGGLPNASPHHFLISS